MTIDDIERLVRRLDRSDITVLSLEDAAGRLTVRLAPPPAPAEPAPDETPREPAHPGAAPRQIRAPAIGRLRLRHPAAAPDPGDDAPRFVRAGDIVAYLEAGLALRPVVAEADGRLGASLQPDGSLVGYGTPLFTLL